MRSSNAVSLPVAAASTGVVAAPSSGSMPLVSVVLVVGDVEGTDEAPVGGDDVLDPPHPETASNAAVATTMETSLRISAAY
jgi:hypothetical protein